MIHSQRRFLPLPLAFVLALGMLLVPMLVGGSRAQQPAAPAVSLTCTPAGLTVSCTTNVIQLPPGVTVVSYVWDYGDGTVLTGQNPSHTYAGPGTYTIFLGGRTTGDRLNVEFKDYVPHDKVASELVPVFARFKAERFDGEGFGDFCHRVGVADLAGQPSPA